MSPCLSRKMLSMKLEDRPFPESMRSNFRGELAAKEKRIKDENRKNIIKSFFMGIPIPSFTIISKILFYFNLGEARNPPREDLDSPAFAYAYLPGRVHILSERVPLPV